MYKIWRSPYSEFGKFTVIPNDLHDETVTAAQVYTDEVLKGIVPGLISVFLLPAS